ncbi:MAG: hypothetical protein ACP5P1_11205 [Acidimicrobiales bacterium]
MNLAASLRSATRTRRQSRPVKRHWTLAKRSFEGPTCEEAREALSCEIDGEHHPVTAKALDRHLQSCLSCSEFASRAPDLRLAEQVLLSRRPPPQLLGELAVAATQDASARHPKATTRASLAARRSFNASPPRRPPLAWMPSRATVGAFALAGGPALAAVCAAALGPWPSHAAIAAHLTSNGCIAPLLAHHLWPGY